MNRLAVFRTHYSNIISMNLVDSISETQHLLRISMNQDYVLGLDELHEF